ESSESMSDHKIIRFRINRAVQPIYYRNKKHTDWKRYKTLVEERLQSVSVDPISCINELEERVSELELALVHSFRQSCQVKRLNPNRKTNPWWNGELGHLRHQVRSLHR